MNAALAFYLAGLAGCLVGMLRMDKAQRRRTCVVAVIWPVVAVPAVGWFLVCLPGKVYTATRKRKENWTMRLPIAYKGRTENGWHRYYAQRAFTNIRTGSSYTVHIDKSRFLAWCEAWWVWINLRITGDEI